MKMSEAIAKQEKALELMQKTYVNMKKKGLRKGTVESYLTGLESRWNDIRALDKEIEKVKDDSTAGLPYFSGWMEEAEEVFLEQRGFLLEALYECAPPTNLQNTNTNTNTNNVPPRPHHRKLPQMDLPKFSGNYTEWASFKNLFTSIIGTGDLTDVERLQYLNAGLTGEPASLIKNIPTTAENYAKAWSKLEQRYENKRIIVNACLNSLFQMKPLLKESAQGLKTLKGTTDDIIEILAALKRPVKHWDDILTYLTIQRLDPKSRRDWETTVAKTSEPSTYKELEDFLTSRIQGLESIEHDHDSMLNVMSSPASTKPCQPKPNSGSHGVRECRSQKSCFHCRGRHHSLLHFEEKAPTFNGSTPKVEVNTICTQAANQAIHEDKGAGEPTDQSTTTFTHTSKTKEEFNVVLMATAQIVVQTNGRKVSLRALLDPCSNASFIKESLAQLLRLPRESVNIPVGGIGGGVTQTVKARVSLNISSIHNAERAWPVTALVLSKLTDYLPPRHYLPAKLPFLEGLTLADPHYTSEEPINMILGLDVYTHIILPGLLKNDTSHVIAQETTLGWILSGNLPASTRSVNCHSTVTNEDLLQIIHKFWEQEEVPSSKSTSLTPEELNCEQHYAHTVRRNNDGRYILKLPFNERISQLADSYVTATRMLFRMEKKFAADDQLHKLYCDFIDEYLRLDHAEIVDPATLTGKKVFYLPHHGVLKGSGEAKKIRVVFNGSVKLAGFNLNDCLNSGAKLLLELRDIIQLWRLLQFVWLTDIVKMFRFIWIDPEDRNYLLIVWRKHPSDKIQIIRLKTVTYGLICAPYQALRTIKQLCHDEGPRFPQAREVLEKQTYMDDSYGGKNSLQDAKAQQKEFMELLTAGGFQLGKWAANHPSLLEGIPEEKRAHSLTIHETETHSVLGLAWQPATDTFTYKVNRTFDESLPLTKRRVLAQSASLYDPLGWIAPIIVPFKIFIQSLWHMGVQWDDEIPPQNAEKWKRLTKELSDLPQVSVPRHLSNTEWPASLELHGFADASEKAMAAVIYLRGRGRNASTCNILIAKTKVAPLKQISLPRLELSAAFMLAKLMKNQVEVLSLSALPKFLWSDSTVALSWIKGEPKRWTTYVGNRVTAIQEAVPDATWSHVAGRLNPADLASRGTTVSGLLAAEYWIYGPEFLRVSNVPWKADSSFTPLTQCPEERKVTLVSHKAEISEWDLLSRYSSWNKLLRVTARCQDYINRLKLRLRKAPASTSQNYEGTDHESSVLQPTKIKEAENFWVKYVQTLYFPEEIRALLNKRRLPKRSRLLKLNPFIDPQGLLRVGVGALEVITETHLRTLHGGTQLVLSTLRQRFWIVNGRTTVKDLLSSCVTCWKQNPAASTQLMGDLPAPRVRPARAFLHTGVDFAGPVSLRMSKGRGVKTTKGYIAVFICYSTRAMHLEVASDYTSEEFIAVYKRFTGRRGICASLYSDCGTNFVGADRQLRQLFQQAGASDKKIAEELLKDRTAWRFNPPGSPHFGGLWEAGVKATKYHLKRIIGDSTLTFEELTTLLIQIEACLNSRPLYPLTDDPSDLSMLTPAHFLIGEPISTIPEPTVLEIAENRLSRWQLVRKMTEDFWKSWSLHYLQSLQSHPKWTSSKPNVKVGDICKIRVENVLPCKWPLGRIIKVSTGSDSKVRIATIKTATSSFERPVTKVCILPIWDNGSSLHDEGGRNVAD